MVKYVKIMFSACVSRGPARNVDIDYHSDARRTKIRNFEGRLPISMSNLSFISLHFYYFITN